VAEVSAAGKLKLIVKKFVDHVDWNEASARLRAVSS
jgi:hypothetical protein